MARGDDDRPFGLYERLVTADIGFCGCTRSRRDRCGNFPVRRARRSRLGLARVRPRARYGAGAGKGGSVEVTDPDLSAFKSLGGKLLMYHGWNNGGTGGAISPMNSVNYYSSILATMGPQQDNWIRLFMVPGMDHCGGGPGPNQFASVTAMEDWRERGRAPDHITAYHVRADRVDRSRPLCPYPQVAVYKGTGDTNEAANFMCRQQ